MWKLLIDQRENCKTELMAELGEHHCQVQQLPLGDFAFTLNAQIVFIIERKTHVDWIQSIKDGRYHEQKNRLLQHYSTQQILYILEGSSPAKQQRLLSSTTQSQFLQQRRALFSAVLNTMFRDQLHVYQTQNSKDTVQFLIDLFHKFKKCAHPNELFGTTLSSDQCMVSSLSGPSEKKKDHRTSKQIFAAQLACLPGISNGIALALIEQHFPSCAQFLNILREQQNPVQFLTELEIITTGTQRKRKLGKVAQTLVEFYLIS